MSNEPEDGTGRLVRGIAGILLLGVALGVLFNALQLASGPRHGLSWIQREVKLASFESVTEAEAGTTTTNVDSTARADTTDTATAPATTSSTHTATATADTSHRASKRGKPAKPTPGKPAPGEPATTPAATPPATPAPTASAAVPTVPDTKEPLEVQYATIKKFWDAGAALFVDARGADEYTEAHIPGAINLPFDDVFNDPDKAKALDTHGRAVVICYCGGGDCDLSRNLAFSLIDAGQKKVLVFMGGLPGWKDAGNAVATGKDPGASPAPAK